MKKLFSAIVIVLALNFLALAGGAAYLFQTGALDREKLLAMKEIAFPVAAPQASTTQPTTQAALPPLARLDELLAQKTGMTTGEQVDFLQQTFDAKTVQLDRRRRELDDLQRQVELAKQQVARDRADLEGARTKLATEQDAARKLQTDQGFQDSLALYQAMPSKQVKSIFMTLDDPTVIQYLQAMGPSGSKKILKEFKSPEEVARVQSIMEKMRLSDASVKD